MKEIKKNAKTDISYDQRHNPARKQSRKVAGEGSTGASNHDTILGASWAKSTVPRVLGGQTSIHSREKRE